MKVLTFTGEYAHLNRFQFQLSQLEKRKCIIVEPQTGLKVVEGKTEKEVLQRLYSELRGKDVEKCLEDWLRSRERTKCTWIEIDKLYNENRHQNQTIA